MEALRAHFLWACIGYSFLLSVSFAVSLHDVADKHETADTLSQTSHTSEHPKRRQRSASAPSQIHGHLNERGIYVADHHHIKMPNARETDAVDLHTQASTGESDSVSPSSKILHAGDSSKQAGAKTPSFMRRELEHGSDEEEDAVLDEWPEMEPFSLSELSSDASLDESFNWWDRRRRRRAIDCKWTQWSYWKSCSAPCGAGEKSRSRSPQGPHWGGVRCFGAKEEFSTCNTQNCPIACEWNHWGAWGPCSATCGVGSKKRKRGALPFTDRDGGVHCPASGYEDHTSCATFGCPVGCEFGAWGLWGGCSKTCGTGVKKRSRKGNGPFHGGAPCLGGPGGEEKCNAFACPIDCAWNAWGAWGKCSKTCGGGLKLRQRMYLPMAHNGGKTCPGSPAELLACNVEECPQDCVWAPWHDPSPCTKTCGGGSFKRFRSKLQEVANGGKSCDGQPSTEIGPCNVEPCAIDCQYSEWSTWSECSESCGGGTKTATRNGTEGEHGGAQCADSNMTQEEACNDVPCPGVMVEGGALRNAASLISLISLMLVQVRMSS